MKTFAEYTHAVRRTANNPPGVPEPPFESRLALRGLGLTGEAGEVADLIKKHLFHGQPLDLEKMQKELGDVAWYLTATADLLGLSLEGIAEANDRKLRARFPNGFDKAASAAKADETKRSVYVASKFNNWAAVNCAQAALKEAGCDIAYDWTVHVHEGEPDESACAEADANGVMRATDLLLIAVPEMRGAFVELGIAIGRSLALGRNMPIHVVPSSPLDPVVFYKHPLVRHHATVEDAVRAIVGA